MTPPTITYLTDVWFAPGAVAALADVLAKLGVRRPLLVTDKPLVALGMVDRLPLSPAAVFDDVETNPTEASVLAGLEVCRQANCDGVVALGGGSPIDCAKGIALLSTHAPPLEQYAFIKGGLPEITADKIPLVAIPTTAGTGSEVGRGALVTFNSGAKLAMLSPHLIPDAAICDPELTLQLPANLTAATGMDAVSHCVETFCSPKFNPVAEAIALDGLRRAVRHIRTAVDDGADLAARGEMMMAALEGGLTFQKGLGLIHALSHPLGAITQPRLHHGMLNAVLLPHVLRFNMTAPASAPASAPGIAPASAAASAAASAPAGSITAKLDALAAVVGAAGAAELPNWFAGLIAELHLPLRLRDMGVSQSQVMSYVAAAAADHCCQTNPRPITADDCRAVLEAAY